MSTSKVASGVTKTFVIGMLAVRMALPLPFIGGVKTTEASILSKVADLFVGTQASAAENDTSDTNSQKMPLLEAPSNPIALGSTSLPTTDATALISTLNPVPDPVASTTTDTPQNNDNSNKITNYKVKSGDTVSGIAEKFNISTNTILWANNLRKDSTLAVGKNLIILPISGVTYTVKSGDTLQEIALKYNGDVQEIMAYNNMANDVIKAGDMIVIPDGEATDASYSKPSTTSTTKSSSSIAKTVAQAVGIKVASAESSDEDAPPIPQTPKSSIPTSYYMRPIKGGTKTQGIHGNNAVDLAEACGTPIYASAAGDITISMDNGAWNGGYGNYVVISHDNGSQTLYGHMSKLFVTEGMHVTQGQQIGEIGNTGKVSGATGCHVHFEIRNGPVNPF